MSVEASGRILVTGASGLLGSHVARVFAAEVGSDGVLLASRSAPRRHAEGGRPTPWITLDLGDHSLRLPSGIDMVVHAAGEKSDESRMTATNVEGTRRLIEAAVNAGVRRFVHISSVGVYGAAPHSGVVNEGFERHPRNPYEVSKDAGERSVREVSAGSGMECVILQPSNVIAAASPSVPPLLGFLAAIQSGRLLRFGRADAWLNYVAVEDVAAAVVDAALRAPAGGTYIVNTPERLEEVVAWCAGALSVSVPRRRLPLWVGGMAARLGDFAAGLGRAVPFDSNRLLELTNTTRYDGMGLPRATGFKYPVGVRVMILRLVHCHASEGRL